MEYIQKGCYFSKKENVSKSVFIDSSVFTSWCGVTHVSVAQNNVSIVVCIPKQTCDIGI